MSSFFNRYWYVTVLLVIIALGLLTLGNYYYVQHYPGGRDFLVQWVGARALFMDGLSPYSQIVSDRIQSLEYWGNAEYEPRFTYPLYSLLVTLPFSLINDYEIARTLWMTALEAALVGLAFLSLRLTRWKMSPWLLPLLLIFTLFWYHSLRPLINGNPVILVALLLAAAFGAVKANRDELAGVMLALSTIRPQLSFVVIIFVLAWTISHRRWRTLGWLVISLVLLSIAAALFEPDWILQNLREVVTYSGYDLPDTPGNIFETWLPATGHQFGWALTAFLGLILVLEWNAARGKDFRWFLWTGCLTLVASELIGVQTDAGNLVLLYLPLILVFALWVERWGRAGTVVAVISLLLLLVVPWVIFREAVIEGDQLFQHPVLLFPLPLFLLVTLYWVRWWGIKPRRLLVDRLREYDQQL